MKKVRNIKDLPIHEQDSLRVPNIHIPIGWVKTGLFTYKGFMAQIDYGQFILMAMGDNYLNRHNGNLYNEDNIDDLFKLENFEFYSFTSTKELFKWLVE